MCLEEASQFLSFYVYKILREKRVDMGELLREIGKGESLIVWIGLSYCCFVVDAVSVGGDTLSCSVCEHAVLRCLLDALKRTQ